MSTNYNIEGKLIITNKESNLELQVGRGLPNIFWNQSLFMLIFV